MDPIDVGMTIHPMIMMRIAQHVNSKEELLAIGRMIDCLVGSAQIHAVEKGLDASPEKYRALIGEKLRSLGLY
jgi:hypothetical protein